MRPTDNGQGSRRRLLTKTTFNNNLYKRYCHMACIQNIYQTICCYIFGPPSQGHSEKPVLPHSHHRRLSLYTRQFLLLLLVGLILLSLIIHMLLYLSSKIIVFLYRFYLNHFSFIIPSNLIK